MFADEGPGWDDESDSDSPRRGRGGQRGTITRPPRSRSPPERVMHRAPTRPPRLPSPSPEPPRAQRPPFPGLVEPTPPPPAVEVRATGQQLAAQGFGAMGRLPRRPSPPPPPDRTRADAAFVQEMLDPTMIATFPFQPQRPVLPEQALHDLGVAGPLFPLDVPNERNGNRLLAPTESQLLYVSLQAAHHGDAFWARFPAAGSDFDLNAPLIWGPYYSFTIIRNDTAPAYLYVGTGRIDDVANNVSSWEVGGTIVGSRTVHYRWDDPGVHVPGARLARG